VNRVPQGGERRTNVRLGALLQEDQQAGDYDDAYLALLCMEYQNGIYRAAFKGLYGDEDVGLQLYRRYEITPSLGLCAMDFLWPHPYLMEVQMLYDLPAKGRGSIYRHIVDIAQSEKRPVALFDAVHLGKLCVLEAILGGSGNFSTGVFVQSARIRRYKDLIGLDTKLLQGELDRLSNLLPYVKAGN
jgi:hypothetical protein